MDERVKKCLEPLQIQVVYASYYELDISQNFGYFYQLIK